MRFKLDENIGTRIQQLFRDAGHDVLTVRDQGVQGCSDLRLYKMCCTEARCLVTLDLDFADVTRFDPGQASGMVVVRPPRNATPALLAQLVRQLLAAVGQISVDRELWIAEIGRIRIHESAPPSGPEPAATSPRARIRRDDLI
jgi:predicted nuclease of predicted toxin-antitoxin system